MKVGWGTSILFLFIVLVSYFVGLYAKKTGFPTVAGYIFTGLLFGGYVVAPLFGSVFGFTIQETIYNLPLLVFVSKVITIFIAIMAGFELNFEKIKPTLNQTLILSATSAITVVLGFSCFLYFFFPVLASIPNLQSLSDITQIQRLALAFLVSSAMLVGAPSVIVATLKDLPIRNYFTTLSLNLIVAINIISSILFAVSLGLSRALFNNIAIDLGLFITIVVSLVSSVIIGIITGAIINLASFTKNKIFGIVWLIIWFCVYLLCVKSCGIIINGLINNIVNSFFNGLWNIQNIELENILVFITAGVYLQNFTKNKQSREFVEEVISNISKNMFLVFFTYIGLGLKLDLLFKIFSFACVLFVVRNIINFGGFACVSRFIFGTKQQQTAQQLQVYTMLPQGGVTVSFAKTIQTIFEKSFGNGIYELIISCLILSQILGPILFKKAIEKSDKL